MRLLRLEDYGEFSLVEFAGKYIPPYAILSHTWGAYHEEVTFKDIVKGIGKSKAGYAKIRFCGKQAAKDILQYIWVDTCCIDKSSSAELSEAINSMFRWYQDAAKCYVYLADVSIDGSVRNDLPSQQTWKPVFQQSRWFTRGWTLQELLAPTSVELFSAEGERLGDKYSLLQEIHDATGISVQALQGRPLPQFSVDERMAWAERRGTEREEDAAYSLLGIFNIYMPLIYGEGRKRAFIRLQKEIEELSRWEKEGRDKPGVPNTGMSSRPSAIVYDNKIYCFHQGNGNNGELWYNVFDGTDGTDGVDGIGWAGDVRVSRTGMSSGPSATVYNNKIYCFHQGLGKNTELWYNVFDGKRWTGDIRVSNINMCSGPSVIVYKNKIYCFYHGRGKNGQLWYNVFDGTSWAGEKRVSNTGLSSGPSATVYKNKIYCFHQGGGKNGELWYNVFDGTNWQGDARVPNTGLSSKPFATVYNDKIYCFHQGYKWNGELWCNVYDGTDWAGDARAVSTGLSSGPSATVYNEKIYLFFQGYRKSCELRYVSNWSNWA